MGVRIAGALGLASAITLTLLAVSAAGAQPKLPTRATAPLVAPADARAVLAGSSLKPLQAAAATSQASTTSSSEIQALARALRNDVDLIFEHVYEHVEYTPIYGSAKGATATLIERVGNDFDQVSLMIALLRESGYTASFVSGVIRVQPAEVQSWYGTDADPNAIGQLLGSAGIPATIFTFPDSSLAFVDVAHVWVKVDIGGTDYVFDPAFKAQAQTPGIDLVTATGYDQASFLTAVLTGATVDPNYLQNLNTAALETELSTYASNLITFIRSNQPDARLDDVVGGTTIVPLTGIRRDLSLPSAQSIAAEWTDIPNTHRATLRVQHQGIDQTFFSDSLSGKRLTIFYDTLNQPVLRLGDAVQATGVATTPGSNVGVTLTVDHPYAAFGGTYADDSQTLNVLAGGSYIVVNGWAETNPKLVQWHRDELAANVAAGGAVDSEPILGETLAMIAFSWLAETSQADLLSDRVSSLTTIHHHTLGVSGQNQSPYIDMPMALVSVVSDSGDTAAATAGFFNGSGHHSAFESGVIQQLQPPHSAVSTVKLLDLANSQGDRIFDASLANYFGVVKPQLVNYSAFEFASVEAYINAGFRVILPQDGDLTDAMWSGIGFIAIGPTESSIGHIIAGGLKGGFGTDPWTAGDVDTDPETESDEHDQSDEPIDLVTGDYLLEQVDMRVGSGEFPFQLEFHRYYNSANGNAQGPLGLGWSHGLDVRADRGSNGFEGMGRDSPIDAAAAIVEELVTGDLLTGPKTADRVLVATLAHRWFMDQLIDNVVSVTEPGRTGLYTLLPDGTYNPPPGVASELSVEPDTSYLLQTKHGVVLDFGLSGQIDTWQDPNGNTVTFTYVSDVLQSVTSSLGRSLSFTYTGDLLTGVSDGNGRSIAYAHDAAGNLTSFTNAESDTNTYEYDSDGLLARIFYPANPATPFVENVYDALSSVQTQTDANGNLWTYYFSGFRSEEVFPDTQSRIFEFDEHGRTLSEIDALGHETRYEYDGLLRTVRRTHPEGNFIEFEYDAKSNLTKETIHPKPSSVEPPREWLYTYEPIHNRIATITEPLLRVTTYSYDANGNPDTIEQPALGPTIPTTNLIYNSRGQVLRVDDAAGRSIAYTYDPVNGDLLTRTVDPAGLALTTVRVYDANGNMTQETDPRSNTVTFDYDDERRLVSLTSSPPFSYQTFYGYDANGNLAQIDRPTGIPSTPFQTTLLAHSPSNKTTSITDAASNSDLREYDALDRLARITDAAGHDRFFVYDGRGDLFQRIDHELNVVEERSYTPNGREASLRDANGNLTTFEYDDFDRMNSVVYPGSSFESFVYDAADNLTRKTTRAGQTITFTHDALDRLETKTRPGPLTTTYQYDLTGHLEQITDAGGTTTMSWDDAERMTSVLYPGGATVGYQYDAADNRTRVTYPDAYYVDYQYDSMSRMKDILDPTTATLAHFDYDALSRRIAQTNLNGTSTSLGYEVDDDLASLQHGFFGESVTFTYTYDGVHRQTSYDVDDPRFLYDASLDTTTPYTPNSLNQYSDVGASTLSYDGNGNLSAYGSSSYVHDVENRMVQATTPAGTTSYLYDGFGRRSEKNVAGTITRYVYDSNRVLVETDHTGSVQRRFVYGPELDEPIAMTAGGATHFYHYDMLGSVVGLSDAAGALVETYVYDPYGGIANPGSLGNPYLFTGRRFDSETGLFFYRSRVYSPALGRFLEVDPVRHTGGMNLYAYVQNDPLNAFDPFGLFRFGKRPLSGAPWIPGGSSNPIDDYFNTEISHEHGFFEDGSGENIGFGTEGRFSEDPEGLGYRYDDKYYDDDLIREALGNIEDGEYSLLGWGDPVKNNCQDWADRLRDEYERVKRERDQAPESEPSK